MDIFKIKLNGGLCNKLFHLFSACSIALKDKKKILEPHLGWNKKILFSDIYDINYFNHAMKPYNNGEDIMVSIKDESKYNIIGMDTAIREKYKDMLHSKYTGKKGSPSLLWSISSRCLAKQRGRNNLY